MSLQVVSDAAVALFAEAEAALTVAKETAAAATSGPSAQATVSEAEIYEFNQVQQPFTDEYASAFDAQLIVTPSYLNLCCAVTCTHSFVAQYNATHTATATDSSAARCSAHHDAAAALQL
jgi:hypothetical protein